MSQGIYVATNRYKGRRQFTVIREKLYLVSSKKLASKLYNVNFGILFGIKD